MTSTNSIVQNALYAIHDRRGGYRINRNLASYKISTDVQTFGSLGEAKMKRGEWRYRFGRPQYLALKVGSAKEHNDWKKGIINYWDALKNDKSVKPGDTVYVVHFPELGGGYFMSAKGDLSILVQSINFAAVFKSQSSAKQEFEKRYKSDYVDDDTGYMTVVDLEKEPKNKFEDGVKIRGGRLVDNAKAKNAVRNANDWIDDPKKKKAMDEIDKKADALYRQLKDIARKFDALKNEQVKVGFYFADYSDAARQIREIHGME